MRNDIEKARERRQAILSAIVCGAILLALAAGLLWLRTIPGVSGWLSGLLLILVIFDLAQLVSLGRALWERLREIEKSPGANRDISRIVQAYPGVAFSPAGYRNDLIVRGGSPSENRFYLDGIEIPNINHFSTQGASGGPVGIINADLIREINFYTRWKHGKQSI